MLRIHQHLRRMELVRAFELLLSAVFLTVSFGFLIELAPAGPVEARTSAPESTMKRDQETTSHNVQADSSSKPAADPAVISGPPDSVVALYFHRTLRCENCLLMESYIDDVIKHDYLDHLLNGSLRWHALDYEKPEHEGSVDKYQFGGPALVLSHWSGGKEVLWARMDEIWDLMDYPEAVADTLRGQLRECLVGTCRHYEFSMPDSSHVLAPRDTTKGSQEGMVEDNDQR